MKITKRHVREFGLPHFHTVTDISSLTDVVEKSNKLLKKYGVEMIIAGAEGGSFFLECVVILPLNAHIGKLDDKPTQAVSEEG